MTKMTITTITQVIGVKLSLNRVRALLGIETVEQAAFEDICEFIHDNNLKVVDKRLNITLYALTEDIDENNENAMVLGIPILQETIRDTDNEVKTISSVSSKKVAKIFEVLQYWLTSKKINTDMFIYTIHDDCCCCS